MATKNTKATPKAADAPKATPKTPEATPAPPTPTLVTAECPACGRTYDSYSAALCSGPCNQFARQQTFGKQHLLNEVPRDAEQERLALAYLDKNAPDLIGVIMGHLL